MQGYCIAERIADSLYLEVPYRGEKFLNVQVRVAETRLCHSRGLFKLTFKFVG